MRALVLLALAACGGSSPPAAEPVSNEASPAPIVEDSDAPCDPPPGRIRGCVVDEHGAPLAGATVRVEETNLGGDTSVVTDLHGAWGVDLPGRHFHITIYYGDLVDEHDAQTADDELGVRLDVSLDPSRM